MLKPPKFLSILKTKLLCNDSLYRQCFFFFAYGHSKRLICVRFVFFHFFYILCLLSLSFFGGGVISINLGYKGGPPKQISNDEAGWSSNYIEATRQIPPAPSPPPPHKKKNQQSLTVRNEKTYFSRRLAPKVAKKSDLRAANVL